MKPKQTFRGAVIQPAPKRPGPASPFAGATNPAQARVRVGREVAGRGGKGVSVITGLPLNAAALEELAAKLKKSCGAGGAVRTGASRYRATIATGSSRSS